MVGIKMVLLGYLPLVVWRNGLLACFLEISLSPLSCIAECWFFFVLPAWSMFGWRFRKGISMLGNLQLWKESWKSERRTFGT